ncbi:MAG: response regulator [Methanomicrobiales archaeon]
MAEKKILIVEDNEIVALETSERLKRLGYIVTGIAATGADAVALARSTQPDLILMDINLKGPMDGITAAEQIGAFLEVPVIYLTAYSDDATLQRAMKTKPVAHLIKPFKERELYSNIEMALYRSKSEKTMKISSQMEELISTFSAMNEGVIVTDKSEQILFMNRAASILTGFSADECVKNPVTSVFTIQRGDPALEKILAGKPSGFPVLQEVRLNLSLVTRSGTSIPVVAETIHINDVHGTPEGYALLFWTPPQDTERER